MKWPIAAAAVLCLWMLWPDDLANVNGKPCFESALGCRVVTDLEGRLISVVSISPEAEVVKVTQNERSWEGGIKPNQVKNFDGKQLMLAREVPFDYPYRVQGE